MNIVNELIHQINLFIVALSGLVTESLLATPFKAIVTLVAFIGLIILVIGTKVRFMAQGKTPGKIINKLMSPITIYGVVYYAYHQQSSSLILILLNSVTLFWLLISLIYLPYLYIQDAKKIRISLVPALLMLGLISHLVSELLINVLTDVTDQTLALQTGSIVVAKIMAVSGLFLYMRSLLSPLLEVMTTAFPFTEKVRPFFKYIKALVMLCGGLWIFDIISFGVPFIFGVALLLICSSVMYFFDIHMDAYVTKLFPSDSYEFLEQKKLSKKSRLLMFLAIAWLYYTIGYDLMNFHKVTAILSSINVINSTLIQISLHKIIGATWLFLILRTVLFIGAKYLRNVSSHKGDSLTSGSVETLTYNLGTLLIIVVSSVELGITWQIVVPVAGAIGIGIGVGIQGILNNYISGFILLFSKKVKIGDIVELEGNAGRLIGLDTDTVFGRVKAIDIFATTIKTFDNVDVAVPNSVFISDNIVNYTQEDDIVRVRVPIGVSYLSDVEQVKAVIMEAINESHFVLKNRPNDVWFNEFGDSSLNFYALCWVDIQHVKHPRNVRVDMIERVWHKFKEQGIEIPFPQQDIWFRNDLKIDRTSGE